VNAAKDAGMATSTEAEEADLAAEGTSTMAADMIEAKEVTEAVATEAKTEAVLQDSKVMVSGDEPMNVEDSAQIKAPTPSAAAQAKSEEMLKKADDETRPTATTRRRFARRSVGRACVSYR